ncbi:aminopeptidase C [Corynebacterium kroppenstedtii]|uniref:aminopeptidase C n=1 Tax=Corynebacterium sp. PCR 32 TaxID=3351342 RepID=UPI0030AADD5B
MPSSNTPTSTPQLATRNSGVLDPTAVASLSNAIITDPTARIAINAVTTTDVDNVALNRQRVTALDHSVSHKTDTWAVANQKKSGRCWIFSGLNSLRGRIMATTGTTDFELSQNYVAFYDKLEKANYFLTAMRELAHRPIEDRTIQHLLHSPIDDGGQWNMFVALINKYGVVPHYAMPETQSSSNTRHMNRDLASALRAGATRLRDAIANSNGTTDCDTVNTIHNNTLTGIYRILTIHLGVPPEKFVWQYRTKDNEFVRKGTLTPQDFATTYLPDDLGDYVCVVNDPRQTSPYGDTFTVEYLGNVVGAKPVTYLNAPIEVLKKATIEALVDGHPVWFGCDTLAQSNRDHGYWSLDLYDYEGIYGVDLSLSKEDRLLSGDSMMTHAMVFTGVDLVDKDNPDFDPTAMTSSDKLPNTVHARRWRVENSWGADKADKGFWTMDDSWFSENVYEIAVPLSRLPKEYRDAINKEPHVLPAWDPMGSLARG